MAGPDAHLVFDLDGTLTDPRLGITRCYAYALEQLGLPAPRLPELERHIGPPLRAVFAELLATAEVERIERGVTLYRERFATIGLFENAPYPEIHATLAELRERGHALWVCTSKPLVYAERILEHFALAEYFRGVYGDELRGAFADKARLLAHLLEREAIPAARAIMIGDRMHDARAARSNGARSIGVLYGFGDEPELTAAGVDALCAQVRDLPSVIAQLR